MSETLNDGRWIEFFSSTDDLDEAAFKYANPTNLPKLKRIWRQIERVQDLKCPYRDATKKAQWVGKRSAIVGKKFENFFQTLFSQSKVFAVAQNVSTESSEIDILITLSVLSQKIPFLLNQGAHILGEAKCHKDGPSVQWVARLSGLMNTHGCSMSLLLTACKSRNVHPKIRSEIHANAILGKPILLVGQKQLLEVLAGKNFLSILKEQHRLTVTRQALAI